MRSLELQEAIYARLNETAALKAIADAVYDHVPQDAAFPYVVVGEDLATPANVDDSLDTDHVAQVHTWSRYRGRTETKQIQQTVYNALHRKPLTVENANYVDCNMESEESFLDDDGLTRHGVQLFRFFLDEVTQ